MKYYIKFPVASGMPHEGRVPISEEQARILYKNSQAGWLDQHFLVDLGPVLLEQTSSFARQAVEKELLSKDQD